MSVLFLTILKDIRLMDNMSTMKILCKKREKPCFLGKCTEIKCSSLKCILLLSCWLFACLHVRRKDKV